MKCCCNEKQTYFVIGKNKPIVGEKYSCYEIVLNETLIVLKIRLLTGIVNSVVNLGDSVYKFTDEKYTYYLLTG